MDLIKWKADSLYKQFSTNNLLDHTKRSKFYRQMVFVDKFYSVKLLLNAMIRQNWFTIIYGYQTNIFFQILFHYYQAKYYENLLNIFLMIYFFLIIFGSE